MKTENIILFFFKHAWAFFFIITSLNAFKFRNNAAEQIRNDPELAAGYEFLFKYSLIIGNLPWLIMAFGDLSGLTNYIFDFFFPALLNPVVLAFHAVVISSCIAGSYWMFFKDGAAFLMKHPGFLNFETPPGKQTKIKIMLIWTLMMAGTVAAELFMWLGKKGPPHFVIH